MTATTSALAPLRPAFSNAERLALAGFLAGYRGLTREAYALDLRQFAIRCRARSLSLFTVRRADIEGLPATWKPGARPAPPSRRRRHVVRVGGHLRLAAMAARWSCHRPIPAVEAERESPNCALVVIGRQVGEGAPKYRHFALRDAASHLPASLALP